MQKLSLVLLSFLLLPVIMIAEETSKKGITDYYPTTADCSANAGPDVEVCYTESSFTLLGEIGTGNISSTPNYTWTGPAGFNFSPNNNVLKPTITRTGGFVPGTYTFTLCMDCNSGTSCNTVTVTIGDDPVQPTSLNAVSTGCNEVTVTALPAPGPGDVGQWTWTPTITGLAITSGATSNVATFERTRRDCRNYTVSYVSLNGGCKSNPVSTSVNPENADNVDLGPDQAFCSNIAYVGNFCGSFPGCNGATGVWSQVSGPPVTIGPPIAPNLPYCREITFPLVPPGVTQSFTLQYDLTVAPGSLCQGGSDQVTYTITGGSGVDLGPNEILYFCGDFPQTLTLCTNTGLPAYNWQVLNGAGVTLSPVMGQPECQILNLPQGSGAPSRVDVRVTDPGINGQCQSSRIFILYRLDDVDVTADTVGLGCVPQGFTYVNLRNYLTGYQFTQTTDVTLNAVPSGSSLPAPSNAGLDMILDVDGCYSFTIIVSNVDHLTGLACSDTVDLVVCRYPNVEQPNAGASQSICATSTILNGSTPTQTGTQVQWSQLSTNPPGAVINNPNQPDPMISGLNTNTNGASYGFVYTFTLDNPNGSCEQSDTVFITIDCQTNPCDTLALDASFDILSSAGNNITFEDQSTIGAGFAISYVTWFFYDDVGMLLNSPGTLGLPGGSLAYTFPGPGTYVACVEAAAFLPNDPNNLCCRDLDCDTIVIEAPDTCALHIADFLVNPSGTTVTFTDNSTHGDVTNWDFDGDGVFDAITAGVGTSTAHTYPSSGTYTVCMVSIWHYSDSACCYDTICKEVFVEGESCQTPTNVKCTQDKNGKITYDWDLVPGAVFYEIAIDINSFFCPCPEPGPTYPGPMIQVPGNSWTPNASWQCASFAIRARCKEGWSSFTSPICMDNCVVYGDSVVYEDPFFGLQGGKRTGSHFDNELRIYPSPASNLVMIEGLQDLDGANLQLLDVAGRVVRSIKIGASDAYSLDVSQLRGGLYFIQVKGGGTSKLTQKVVIQH